LGTRGRIIDEKVEEVNRFAPGIDWRAIIRRALESRGLSFAPLKLRGYFLDSRPGPVISSSHDDNLGVLKKVAGRLFDSMAAARVRKRRGEPLKKGGSL